MRTLALALALFVATASRAQGTQALEQAQPQGQTAPATQGQTPPGAKGQPAPPAATAPGEDIELLPPERVDPAAKQKQAALGQAIRTRRTLLELHQAGGFALLAALGTTVVLGQLNYADKYGGGGDTGKYMTAHKAAAFTSAGLFAATGLLALLAPSPFDRPLRVDTATLHKAAMATATAGMAAQIILGVLTANHEGSISQRDFARAHQIIGYATFAATATGTIVLLF